MCVCVCVHDVCVCVCVCACMMCVRVRVRVRVCKLTDLIISLLIPEASSLRSWSGCTRAALSSLEPAMSLVTSGSLQTSLQGLEGRTGAPLWTLCTNRTPRDDSLCKGLYKLCCSRGVVHLDKAAEPAVQHTQLSMLSGKPRLLPLPL